ncbi:MAG: pseudouridine synthase [Cyclobacteriaceae bacterium]|nr:MAG: pseudouridine synthase [Cyclobacteriaceae bacterium]
MATDFLTGTEEDDDDGVSYEEHRLVADAGQSLVRLDKFITDRLPNVTRTKVQKAIEAGLVMVNQKPVKANYRVHPHDEIVLSLPKIPRLAEVVPENIPLDIVYEDDYLLVVNKPAGMVVHPAYQNWTGTLVNALAWHFQHLPQLPGNEGKPGLVHRIDKDTSGLLVIAKTEEALQGLAEQFFHHTIERTYWALVWGEPEPPEGTIDVFIGRSPGDRRIITAFPDASHGKRAVTHYRVIKPLRYVSLVECRLETGRTHQIRAHMKYLGHPLFNDATYGGNRVLKGTVFTKYRQFVENCFKLMPRQALHAKTLGFVHPVTREKLNFRFGNSAGL